MSNILGHANKDDLMSYRKLAIKEYIFLRKGLTQSEKAKELHEYAYIRGWTTDRHFTGTMLKELGTKRNVTQWMVRTVFEILLDIDINWQPRTDKLWSLFIHTWMYYNGPFDSVQEAIDSLPAHMDKEEARKWIEFFENRLQASPMTQLLYCLHDKDGKKVSKDNISEGYLRKELTPEFGDDFDWGELNEKGYSVSKRYIAKESIVNELDVPNQQKHTVLKNI